MAEHWHAYTYTGQQRPPDREARDPLSATPPLVIAEWLGKPRSMLAGTFTALAAALVWLEQQLAEVPPMPSALSADAVLAYARERIAQDPGDQVTRYYTSSAYVCRDLVRCPAAGPCPNPP